MYNVTQYPDSFVEWYNEARKMYETEGKQAGQRRGQYFYNHLYHAFPEMAQKVNGSVHDPFYRDSMIKPCMNWLADNWP